MRAVRDRPNIVLVNCDDLGYGDLGCYGSRVNNSPVLDEMASAGIRFTDFYMASSVCSPSRGAMLTGCYPGRIGFDQFDGGAGVLFPGYATGLHQDEITIADVLRGQGYATKLVGKWHCGDQPEFLPTRHGFDSYYGLPYSNDMGRQAGGKGKYPPLPLLRDEQIIQLQPEQAGLTERYVEEAVRFIRDHREQPFFLYFAHMYVHLPIYTQKPFLDASRNGEYGGAVACIDWAMSVLLFELRQLGIDRNTLVVFTSDNGSRGDHGGSNAPLRGRKGSTWEGGQRVPCIMYWPGAIPGGQTCQELVCSMDFLPTFARFAGTTEPSDRIIDGRDIRDLVFGVPGARSPHDSFFYYSRSRLEAVRSGRWKLHVAKRGEEMLELYDLESDIGESSSVTHEHPEVVKDLLAKLEACRIDLGDSRTGMVGRNRRPAGWAENPVTLTLNDIEEYPYIALEYDLSDRG